MLSCFPAVQLAVLIVSRTSCQPASQHSCLSFGQSVNFLSGRVSPGKMPVLLGIILPKRSIGKMPANNNGNFSSRTLSAVIFS